MKLKFGTTLLAGISLSALLPATAYAQSENAVDREEQQQNIIIVTAQKRAENIQDVPISITAIGGGVVEDLNAATLQGLEGAVPNVEIGNFSNTPNTAVFTIRGIGVIEPDPYAGNTVGIVVDDQPQFFSMGALLDLYDVERIEILRGPQGTLFGANTTGGVVNVVNTRPQLGETQARASFGIGNYDMWQAEGMLNLPLNDNLAARFVVKHAENDGYVTNVINGDSMGDRDFTGFRGMLRLNTGNLDATLIGQYDRARNGSPIVVAGDLPGEAEFVPEGFMNMYRSPCLPAGSRCVAPDTYFSARDGGALNDAPDQSDMDVYRVSLNMTISDTPIGDITSISAYRDISLFEFTDQDGTPVFLIDTRRGTDAWQISQELRTDIEIGDRFDLTIGGLYMKTHYDHYQDLRIDFAGGVTYDIPTMTVTKGLPGLFQKNMQEQDNHSASLFAQGYFDVTDRLTLQAGIRYTNEKTEMLASTATSLSATGVTTFDGDSPDGTPNIDQGTAAPPLGSESWNNIGWKLGLDYEVNNDIMLYGYWARGFKSGGFTGRIGIPQDLGPYNPEKVDTFEIGMKGDFADRLIRFNLAGFYTNYRDMQLAQIYFAGTGANLIQGNTILNAASSDIWGVETELGIFPVDGLSINASVAYLSAEYSDFDFVLPSGTTLDLSGGRLQNAPKWTGNIGFDYKFDLSETLSARFGANYAFSSEKLLTSIIDTARASIQPTHVVNAHFDVMVGERFTIGVWANNLFDERYINSVFDSPGTIGLVNYAPPRTYGLRVTAEY